MQARGSRGRGWAGGWRACAPPPVAPTGHAGPATQRSPTPSSSTTTDSRQLPLQEVLRLHNLLHLQLKGGAPGAAAALRCPRGWRGRSKRWGCGPPPSSQGLVRVRCRGGARRRIGGAGGTGAGSGRSVARQESRGRALRGLLWGLLLLLLLLLAGRALLPPGLRQHALESLVRGAPARLPVAASQLPVIAAAARGRGGGGARRAVGRGAVRAARSAARGRRRGGQGQWGSGGAAGGGGAGAVGGRSRAPAAAAGRQGRRRAKGAIAGAAAASQAARVHVARGGALRSRVEDGARAVDVPACVLVHLQALQGKDAAADAAGAPRSAIRRAAGAGAGAGGAASAARQRQRARVHAQGRQRGKDARIVAQGARSAVLHVVGQVKDGDEAAAKGALVLGARCLVLARALVNGQRRSKVKPAAGGTGDASGVVGRHIALGVPRD